MDNLPKDRYSPRAIEADVIPDIDRLFEPWRVGRPSHYVPDPTTKRLVALGYWLDDMLRLLGCNEPDRKTQLGKYNRLSRSYDMWDVAAECLNDVLDGTIEQNRQPHRRWG